MRGDLVIKLRFNMFYQGFDLNGSPGERGQGLVEYAFIMVLIALVVLIMVALLGEAVGSMYDGAINQLVEAFTGGATP